MLKIREVDPIHSVVPSLWMMFLAALLHELGNAVDLSQVAPFNTGLPNALLPFLLPSSRNRPGNRWLVGVVGPLQRGFTHPPKYQASHGLAPGHQPRKVLLVDLLVGLRQFFLHKPPGRAWQRLPRLIVLDHHMEQI